jgi:hypothetical protein
MKVLYLYGLSTQNEKFRIGFSLASAWLQLGFSLASAWLQLGFSLASKPKRLSKQKHQCEHVKKKKKKKKRADYNFCI